LSTETVYATRPRNMAGYRIPKQREGTRVSYWADPRGPDHGVCRLGVVVEHWGDNVFIVWDDDDEFYETWPAGECKYRVDRGQMRFRPPPKERRIRLPPDQVTCRICGRPRQLKCGCPRPGAPKPEEWGQVADTSLLTPSTGHDMMDILIGGNAPDRKGAMMARKAKVVEAVDEEVEELEELETLDEVTDDDNDTEGGDFLTAKAAASMLGTNGRTLRKFLRSKFGTVGQGKRWAISADEVDDLKAEFAKWSKGSRSEPKPKAVEAAVDDDDNDELEEIEDIDFVD